MPIHRIFGKFARRRIPNMCLYLNHPNPYALPAIPEKLPSFRNTQFGKLVNFRFFNSSRPCYTSTRTRVSASSPHSGLTSAARIPRAARAVAEGVLFDYLHHTRCMQYYDADHISKNCPIFLDSILSKLRDKDDVNKALLKYLRYNPINEFEPFLESLGLAPPEIPPLLPRDLMFLTDDELMIENYHVLCNYGIPRSRIGKMYKQEGEIFRYNYGVLASKLRDYEKLGLSVTNVVKLVSCCPSLLVGGVNTYFIDVLGKLKDMGIESDWITGHLSDGSVFNWGRMLEMIRFLEKMGCDKYDMGKLFNANPSLLIEDSRKKVYVLVSVLLKVSLKMDDVLVLFLKYPKVLAGKFTRNLWKAVQFLSGIGMQNDDIAKIVRENTQMLGTSALRNPVRVLSALDIAPERLCELILENPLNLITLASKSNASMKKVDSERGGHLMEKSTFLLSLGYVENSEEMVKALKQFRGRGDQLQERFDCLVNAGLDYHVVSNMIKAAPPVLNQSKDVLEMKIHYLVNHLGYPIKLLEGFPTYLCYDIEKIKLRFSMYIWLREKGKAKHTIALSTILACSDARFVKYFVYVHPNGPAEWERLRKSSS